MTEIHQGNLYQLIWETRRLFQCLKTLGDALHQEHGITASMRAVLEFLDKEEPQTVPQMASRRNVSRQNIQLIVNELIEKGLLEAVENPAHKRSQHIQRTEKGRSSFEQIKQREASLLAEIAGDFSDVEMGNAAETMRNLREHLNSEVISTLSVDE